MNSYSIGRTMFARDKSNTSLGWDGWPYGGVALEPTAASRLTNSAATKVVQPADDLSRDVYCLLGLPIDATDMPTVVRRIAEAVAEQKPYLISTPNLNYLISARNDAAFRETLLSSNLCPADGVAIVWIAWLLGIPIKQRVAGSDLFDALNSDYPLKEPLKVFFFGGSDKIARAASEQINSNRFGMECVGHLNPGFGAVGTMSSRRNLSTINSSRADFLAVCLGAKKGQAWLLENHDRLAPPVRVHLGAVIKFQAGEVRRAPKIVQRAGLEWLWRIKEEPQLWRRYWDDGRALLRLILTRVAALSVRARWQRLAEHLSPHQLRITGSLDGTAATLNLSGDATARSVEAAIRSFRDVFSTHRSTLTIKLTETRMINSRFLGLLLMVSKRAKEQGTRLTLTGASGQVKEWFRLNDLDYLLTA